MRGRAHIGPRRRKRRALRTVYLAYALKAGAMQVPVAEGKTYTVEAVDRWNMTSERMGRRAGGRRAGALSNED